MVSYEEYCEAVQVIKEYKLQQETEKFVSVNAETKFIDLDCSVRLYNAIRNYYWCESDLNFSQELAMSKISEISISKFSKIRNAGKGTIKELQELCFNSGISLQP
jgi:hypothetical protein